MNTRRNVLLVLLLLPGCDSSSDSPDAAAVDAAPVDAGAPDALAVGPLTVHATSSGSPMPNLDVVLHDETGAPIAETTTDADGMAVLEGVVPGDMVTVVEHWSSGLKAHTVMGVKPGWTLEVGSPRPGYAPDRGAVTLQMPGPLPPEIPAPAEPSYRASIGCTIASGGDPSATYVLGVTSTCPSAPDGSLNALALAYDLWDPVAYSSVRSIPMTGAAPDQTGSATFPAWRSDFAALETHITNMPFADEDLSGGYTIVADGQQLLQANPSADPEDTTASFTWPWAYPADIADDIYAFVMLQGKTTSEYRYRTWKLASPFPVSMDIDLESDLPGLVGEPVFDATDPARPQFSWSTTGSVAGADALWIAAHGADSSSASYDLAILAPPDTPQPVQFPRMPDDLAGLMPDADVTFYNASVAYHDFDDVPDYDGYVLSYGEPVWDGTWGYMWFPAGSLSMTTHYLTY